MVHTMTDETYAVNCTMLPTDKYTDTDRKMESEDEKNKRFDIMFPIWKKILCSALW